MPCESTLKMIQSKSANIKYKSVINLLRKEQSRAEPKKGNQNKQQQNTKIKIMWQMQ